MTAEPVAAEAVALSSTIDLQTAAIRYGRAVARWEVDGAVPPTEADPYWVEMNDARRELHEAGRLHMAHIGTLADTAVACTRPHITWDLPSDAQCLRKEPETGYLCWRPVAHNGGHHFTPDGEQP